MNIISALAILLLFNLVLSQYHGPSHAPRSYFLDSKGKPFCSRCSFDCGLLKVFNNYRGQSTCKFRYFHYGCVSYNLCFSPKSFSTMELAAVISYCAVWNGCKLQRRFRRPYRFKRMLRKLAYLNRRNKKFGINLYARGFPARTLNDFRQYTLYRMHMPPGVYVRFKQIQDVGDSLVDRHTFEAFRNRRICKLFNPRNLPRFLRKRYDIRRVSRSYFNRLARDAISGKLLENRIWHRLEIYSRQMQYIYQQLQSLYQQRKRLADQRYQLLSSSPDSPQLVQITATLNRIRAAMKNYMNHFFPRKLPVSRAEMILTPRDKREERTNQVGISLNQYDSIYRWRRLHTRF